jgi:hypothetical protein
MLGHRSTKSTSSSENAGHAAREVERPDRAPAEDQRREEDCPDARLEEQFLLDAPLDRREVGPQDRLARRDRLAEPAAMDGDQVLAAEDLALGRLEDGEPEVEPRLVDERHARAVEPDHVLQLADRDAEDGGQVERGVHRARDPQQPPLAFRGALELAVWRSTSLRPARGTPP